MRSRSLVVPLVTAATVALTLGLGAAPAAALETSTTSTTTDDAVTGSAWSGAEVTGASAYDTATVTGDGTNTPTGTVTYWFFSDGTCTAPAPSPSPSLALSDGVAPQSPTQGPLPAGAYSFDAAYSGDAVYSAQTSACEPFDVGQAVPPADTAVFDDATNSAWSGTEVAGARAYDTAAVSGNDGIEPSGTVAYSFFRDGTCSGFAASTRVVNLSGGAVPDSVPTGTLVAGPYSFEAAYSGDANYSAQTSSCEVFSVGQATPSAATALFDASTNAAWSGTEVTGASAYGTATVTGNNGVTPTGTVTYSFFSGGTCTAPATSTQIVNLSAGSVPNSDPTGALGAGAFSFEADYGGDANYSSQNGSCEPFNVGAAGSPISSALFDASTDAAWSGTEVTGASAVGTATVTGNNGVTPTGTVTYSIFSGGTCMAPATSTQIVNLSAGSVPDSDPTGALGAGAYSFEADYSGDANYSSQTGSCEPFNVDQATPATATAVDDTATGSPWSGTEVTGANAVGTATVTGNNGVTPTGTVTYSFFSGGACTAPATSTQIVNLSAGNVPDSDPTGALGAGAYSFEADYSGDANYSSQTGSCEPFSVGQATPATATAVDDTATGSAWSGTEVTGANADGTATVIGNNGVMPTGTVTYSFFSGGASAAPATSTQIVNLSAGNVPDSAPTGALGAGAYSFEADYSGDANYSSQTGSCEPFNVDQATPATATVVFDASTNAAWTNSEVAGAKAYDTATVSANDGIEPTGTVTYLFFRNGGCSGTAPSTRAVQLSGGNVPNSYPSGALEPGAYSFQAAYGGDVNYGPSAGACEPFTVSRAVASPPTITNLPTSAVFGGSFTASVATTGDGTVSVSSLSPGTCSVGADGLTVSYVAAGECGLVAAVGAGPNYGANTGSNQQFGISRATPSAPVVSNIPVGATEFGGFTASVETNGDGAPSVTSSSPGVCAVGSNGVSVTYVGFGTCSLTASVGQGQDYLGRSGSPQTFLVSSAAHGYWLVGSDGGIFSFGAAGFHGSMGGVSLQRPVVGITPTADRNGYWLVASDGGIFSFGDAGFFGSIPGLGLNPADSHLPHSLDAPDRGDGADQHRSRVLHGLLRWRGLRLRRRPFRGVVPRHRRLFRSRRRGHAGQHGERILAGHLHGSRLLVRRCAVLRCPARSVGGRGRRRGHAGRARVLGALRQRGGLRVRRRPAPGGPGWLRQRVQPRDRDLPHGRRSWLLGRRRQG